jgi:transposase
LKFEQDVAAICELYRSVGDLHARGTHVVSTDERTGMQALERLHPTLPTIPGSIERVEFEYIRHGTLCLTANFDVLTGSIIESTIAETRTNEDFLGHVQRLVGLAASAGWIIVADNLDTHRSELLVRWVAEQLGDGQDLGEMSKSGILGSRKSRSQYLSDSRHRIRFVYTPRHTSWMNQVEMWFSVLSRRFLARASFTSLAELRARLLAFINYFNEVLAHPYSWTYTGRPLRA